MNNADAVPPTGRDSVERLCRALNVDPRKLYAPDAQDGLFDWESERRAVLIAGKLIAAYYRVLNRAARPAFNIEISGAHLDEEPEVPVVDLQEDEPDVVELNPRKQRSPFEAEGSVTAVGASVCRREALLLRQGRFEDPDREQHLGLWASTACCRHLHCICGTDNHRTPIVGSRKLSKRHGCSEGNATKRVARRICCEICVMKRVLEVRN
jgi:hypothetical protein